MGRNTIFLGARTWPAAALWARLREPMARWAEIASRLTTSDYVRRAEYVRLHQTFSVRDMPGRRPMRSYSQGHSAAVAEETVHTHPTSGPKARPFALFLFQ